MGPDAEHGAGGIPEKNKLAASQDKAAQGHDTVFTAFGEAMWDDDGLYWVDYQGASIMGARRRARNACKAVGLRAYG